MQYKQVTIDELSAKAVPVLEKYKIKKAAVFGSCARGEMQRGSDIDLLIDASEIRGGLIFVEIKRKLENILGRKVDLISYKSLDYSNIKNSILSEAKVIYEKRQ
ncbi:MAG TPA: hypothetical protein DD727_02410 [Clostridiales bacterium]|nr:hypothetical protein [Clostridiales bacterium]